MPMMVKDGEVPKPAVTETEQHRTVRLQVKTRRRRYLEINPEYFDSPSLELADPLLYDRMIRQFQTASEREADGRKKGYSGKLEVDLVRSEAKLAALAHPDPNSPLVYRQDASGAIVALDQNEEDRPKTRERGQQIWREEMEQRFLRGEDVDIDYMLIDHNPAYDDHLDENRRRQDEYFDDENEEFVGNNQAEGQTGIQDF